MNRILLASLIAALIGCAAQPQPAAAQTPAPIADRKAALVSYVNASTETRVGQIEQALAPLGYVPPTGPVDPPPPQPGRVIFTTTHETGPNQLGLWEKYERAVYNSGSASVSIAEVSNAKSGRYVLKETISGSSGARVFALNDWSTGSRKPMPYQTNVTVYAYMPTRPTGSWMMLLGWKQTGTNTRVYNQPTVDTEFSSDMTYLRANIKGRTSSAASPGSEPALYYVTQPTSSRVAFPTGRWVKLEMQVKHSTGSDGYYRLYQDGVQILSYSGKTMRSGSYGDKVEFELTCYGGNMSANTTLLYDDVTILQP